jgi:hypothetical protein
MPQPKLSDDILAAALEGFEAQKKRIDVQIAEIRGLLGGTAASSESAKPKRKVSASARRRMALAQKLRWKKIKQGEPAPPPTFKPKRKLSAAARKSIAAAQRKRWAAIKKAAKPQPSKTNRKKAAAPEQSVSAPSS